MIKRNLFYYLLTAVILFPQEIDRDFDQEIDHQSKVINDLKKEIENTRKKLQSEQNKEKSTARNLTNLEEEISLLEKLISQLQKEEKKVNQELINIEGNISAMENELTALRIRYANRAVSIYKRGSLSDIERVLSSTSWRQAIYRAKYQKIISQIDMQEQIRIQSLIMDISKKKLDTEALLRKSSRLKNEREKQFSDLKSKRKEKKKELEKIRTNQTQLSQFITEKEAGVKELEALIEKIKTAKDKADREARIKRSHETMSTKSIELLKGQLPWPTEGEVVAKFGRKWNPELKTTTENTGIDIKGKPGTPVKTVMGGIVTTITFIRGYGNIIIIDHGGNYYTIYSHVTNIQTNMDSEVKAGDVIAYMGDSGSIEGAKLHFEIWGQDQRFDPELWLVKR